MATFSNSLAEWQDTIAAIATPPGVGALGIIRLSGNSAIAIADKLMPRLLLHTKAANTIHVGWLVHHDERIDEVVVSIYRAPRSFTGEDVVELSCHGSSYILQKVMNALLQSGARLAKPGEYTQRAFLNGKLDLAQAEAVADQAALPPLRIGLMPPDRLQPAPVLISAFADRQTQVVRDPFRLLQPDIVFLTRPDVRIIKIFHHLHFILFKTLDRIYRARCTANVKQYFCHANSLLAAGFFMLKIAFLSRAVNIFLILGGNV